MQDALLASLGLQQGTDQQQQSQQAQPGQSVLRGTGALDSIPRFQVPRPNLQPVGSGVPGISGGGGADVGNRAVAAALAYKGMPYQWGGNGQGGIDCSGLVQQVYGRLGVQLPRTTYDQVNSGQAVGSLNDARPGDLIFLHGNGHVGIYAGNGQMIDANHTGGSVDLRSLNGYGDIAAIRRVM